VFPVVFAVAIAGTAVTVWAMRPDQETSSSERVPDFLGLAGSVVVPVEKRGVEWGDVVSAIRSSRAHFDDELTHVG